MLSGIDWIPYKHNARISCIRLWENKSVDKKRTKMQMGKESAFSGSFHKTKGWSLKGMEN